MSTWAIFWTPSMKGASLRRGMSTVEAKMKSRMDRNLLAQLTNGQQQRSNHLIFLETENDPLQKSSSRTSSGLATERHPKEKTKRLNPLKGKWRARRKHQRNNRSASTMALVWGPWDTMREPILRPMRKKAERLIVTSLVKFHQRRTERLSFKLRELQQAKSSRKNTALNVNSLPLARTLRGKATLTIWKPNSYPSPLILRVSLFSTHSQRFTNRRLSADL